MEMNGRERVARAMRHEPPDRVPVMAQLALGHYFLHDDHQAAEIWFDSGVFAETLSRFCEKYGFDGFLVNLPGRPINWREHVVNRRLDGANEILNWDDAFQIAFPKDDCPHLTPVNGKALGRADYLTVDPLDPGTYRLSGYVWNTWHAPCLFDIPLGADLRDAGVYPSWFTSALRAARTCETVSVHAEVFSPFTHLMELFGYEQALMALLDRPEICHVLLEQFSAMVNAMAANYADCSPDVILISSAFTGGGFISRDMYQEFVLPYERKVVEAIQPSGIAVYTHTCGAIGDRMDLMEQTGIDGIDTLDPPPLGTVDLGKAKREFGDRLFFKGNLDAVNELLMGDDQTFEKAVIERLTVGKPGSGYILSPACSAAPHVRPERLMRLAKLAEQYGKYEVGPVVAVMPESDRRKTG